jgi:hypothetical protein
VSQFIYEPTKAIKNVTIYCTLQINGTVYFDQVALQQKIPSKILEIPSLSHLHAVITDPVICVSPLEPNPNFVPDQEGSGDPCILPCVVDIWDNQEIFDAVFPMMGIMSWASLVGSAFVFVTWLLFKRKYPDRLVIYLSGSIMIVAARGVVNSFYSHFEVSCRDRFTFLDITDPICAFDGTFVLLVM